MQGVVVGSGYGSLRNQMEKRFDHMNRQKAPQGLKRALATVDLNRLAEESQEKDSYGCVAYLPESLPEEETTESQEEHRIWLKEQFSNVISTEWDEKKISAKLKLC